MGTFLFDRIIFGPVWSRRLGESLGINLLPAGRKVCNFNCIYCECGLTPSEDQQYTFPSVEEVSRLLEDQLRKMKDTSGYLDSITFAGNGEPTLHPGFPEIIENTVRIRNRYFPGVSIAVLSNATLLNKQPIFKALMKVDRNVLKLDSAVEETLKKINCPRGSVNLNEILGHLRSFNGKVTIQTLFLRGICNGSYIDNTTDNEVESWINALLLINPENVMIYSLARDTAMDNLEQVSEGELITIADRLEQKGIKVQVTP